MERIAIMPVRDVKYFRTHKVHELTKEDYELALDSGMFYVFYPDACGIYSEDVPQTPPDENPDGVGWPYEMNEDCIDKFKNVTQEHFEAFVGNNCLHEMIYQGHGHNYDVFRCRKCGLEEEK